MPPALARIPRHRDPSRVPRPLGDGRFSVDATWGVVQPIQLAPGVRTIGEVELVEHLARGLPAVDTRQPDFAREPTIPGARRIPHRAILDHLGELDPGTATVFFCNGPQCTATPDAIRRLLDAGYPATAIVYYRGGIHDWVTLGYPTRTQSHGANQDDP
jgi:rhodanese-related sulfurtransferase